MFSDYNSNIEISVKSPNIWKFSNTLLNNPRVKKKVSKKIVKYFEPNENIQQVKQKREIYSTK